MVLVDEFCNSWVTCEGIDIKFCDECCGALAVKESSDDVDDTAATGLWIPSWSFVLVLAIVQRVESYIITCVF